MNPTSVFIALWAALAAVSVAQSNDATVMEELKKSINAPAELGWSDSNPCLWEHVDCDDGRVTRIQIGHQNLVGTLPPNLSSLTALKVIEVQGNQLSGSLQSFSGMNSLETVILSNNNFTFIPSDFFDGLGSLQEVHLDSNPFLAWSIPIGLTSASTLRMFSANSANVSGPFPGFFGADTFPSLTSLHLAFNNLEGALPSTLAGSSLSSLWLNGQTSSTRLNGSLAILQNMTQLSEVWLHENSFSGPLPDFTALVQLQNLSLRDNSLTGPVPSSLVGLKSLGVVNLTNNLLQGETPKFSDLVKVDMTMNTNSFCLPSPGAECDSRVNALLKVVSDFGYPVSLAQNWKGNDPCASWIGITCNNGNITVINFHGMELNGVVSPRFSLITSLQRLVLSNNNLTGTIPSELTSLTHLIQLDVSNNQIYGIVPGFRNGVALNTDGNVNIGKNVAPSSSDGRNLPGVSSGGSASSNNNEDRYSALQKKKIIGPVVGGVCALLFVGAMAFCFVRTRKKRCSRVQTPYTTVIHPRFSSSDDAVKITVAGSVISNGLSDTQSQGSIGQHDLHIVESGNMVISIQVLKNVTDNFSGKNILGRGGFELYTKAKLHDGTKIAVKRMEVGVITDKGLEEFKSEIAVLTKVRHRNLVALLGYCLDGNERLLVYEYMPQGALSRFLFCWKEEGLKPLEWMKRLTIALDVARGVEYLHGLAHQSFIHRDLKPSNILIGDDMRAKVADFGLVRLAPDGKASVATKLAGTFGYLAPEYAVTGRVSTKIDVFSFGVILMEMITGRKALDESLEEELQHLVPWFRRMLVNKDSTSLEKAIDPAIQVDEETLGSISAVAELAGHCSAREPQQRPDMGHVVNVLSSLVEIWRPSEPTDPEDVFGIDYEMTLPQALKKWQALEGTRGVDVSSSCFDSSDNTQTSIPTRPSGFADSFTSIDGR